MPDNLINILTPEQKRNLFESLTWERNTEEGQTVFTGELTDIEKRIYDEIIYADKENLGATKVLKDAYLASRGTDKSRIDQENFFSRKVFDYVCHDILCSNSVGYFRKSLTEAISVEEDTEEDLKNNIVAKACEYVAEQINYARLAYFLYRYYWERFG